MPRYNLNSMLSRLSLLFRYCPKSRSVFHCSQRSTSPADTGNNHTSDSFHTPGKIDILLGSAIFWKLLCVGQIKLGRNQPIAQKIKLGWIIAGPLGCVGSTENSLVSGCSISNTAIVEEQLERSGGYRRHPLVRAVGEWWNMRKRVFVDT